jgi:hypothetical protein
MQERKSSGETRNSLHNHRVIEVRQEARAALLAYAFLRGRRYDQVERAGSRKVDWKRVAQIVRKFGETDCDEAALKTWAATGAAGIHLPAYEQA